MPQIVTIFIISIIFFLIAAVIKPTSESKYIKQTSATISSVIYSETGNVMYYVRFFDNGQEVTYQTIYYSSSTKSLNPGDQVDIGYYYMKNNSPRAIIYDDRIVPCSDSIPTFRKVVIIGGILLFSLAFFLLLKRIIL